MTVNQRKKTKSDDPVGQKAHVEDKKSVSAAASTDGRTFRPVTLVLLAVAMAALVASFVRQAADPTLASFPPIPPPHLRLYPTPETIVKEDWPADKPVAKHVVGSPRPRVFKGTFVNDWTVMSTWNISNPDFVSKIAPKIANIYVGPTSYFGPLYREHKPMGRIAGVSWDNPYSMRQMDKQAFFDKISTSDPTSSERLYYTGDLNSPQLARDLASPALEAQRGALLANKTLASPAELSWREFIMRPQGQRVNVWVGEEGVVTHLHVDSYENFFLQVQGVKRFLLFPPKDLHKCDQFPYMHPSFGQAQAYPHGKPHVVYSNATEAELSAHIAAERALHPALASAAPLEVVLFPGDLLYLPPYWGHHVETLAKSISINFWSNSAWQEHFDESLKLVVRYGVHEWTPEQRRTAAAVWMRALMAAPAVADGIPDVPASAKDASLASAAARAAVYHRVHIRPRFQALLRDGIISLYPGSETQPQYSADPAPAPAAGAEHVATLREDAYATACRMQADMTVPDVGPSRHVDILKGFGLVPPETSADAEEDEPMTNEDFYRGMWLLGSKLAEKMAKVPADLRGAYIGNLLESLALWATGHVADDASEVAATLHCMANVNIQ